MGRPMAINLIKAGFSVKGFDLSPAALEEFQAAGGKVCKTAQDVLLDSDRVVTMLPSSPHVEGLYLGAAGLLAQAKPGTLFLECSTIAPQSARKVSEEAAKRGQKMIDAPVSGGTRGAQEATLTFIVGGTAENLELARPLLSKMGKNIFHAGKSGAGQVAKICNNMLLAIHMAGTAEALALGIKNGMDPKILSEIMAKSSGRNWSLEVYNPFPGVMENAPASKNYQGGFAVDLMKKDLGLSQEAAQAVGLNTELGKMVLGFYEKLSEAGLGKLDFSSIQKKYLETL
jgi:3-hydroxyisobutyrate dehydrogenase